MLRVRDLMTKQVVSLAIDATVQQAKWSFCHHNISGAPVRDDHGRVVGILSKSNLVDPMRDEELDPDTPIAELMTAAVYAVHPDEPAIEAARCLVDNHLHRVLVMRNPGEVEGIITSYDVLLAVVNGGALAPSGETDDREAATRLS